MITLAPYRTSLLLAILGVASCFNEALARPATFRAEIRRTSFGVPHILAQDEAGIGYGFGYAYAQDNFCMFAEIMVTVNGERSRYFGPDAIGGPDFDTGSIELPNLQSDFFFKLLNSPKAVATAWQRQDTESRALVRGVAAGYNRYLSDAGPKGLPAQCRTAPWVRRIDERDVIRFLRRLAAEGSSISLMRALVAAQPPGTSPSPTAAFEVDLQHANREWLGSNAVALGKDATTNGRGLLFGNPHYPWYGSLRFYQVHLTIPGKLDAMGVTFGGFPVVRAGFNARVAWTHTVNTSGHVAFYSLQLDPQDPTRYVVDGRTKAMTRETVHVDVKAADGGISSRSHDFWRSDFGLLVTLPGKLEWDKSKAYALFNPSFENDRMIETWYAMDRARSVDELLAAVSSHLGVPWTNTVAADADGNTLYTSTSVVPRITQAKQDACVAEPNQKLIEQNLWVLTASAACSLENEAGVPQPGVFAGHEQPALRRTDYVQNSNDSGWLANPEQRLTGFPQILSKQDYPQSGRTRIGITQIRARLDGTDGLGGNRFDMPKLQQIVFDDRSYFGGLLRADLQALCADSSPILIEGQPVEIAAACSALAKWDGRARLDSIGYFIAMKWIRGFAREKDIWSTPFDARDPVNTPRGFALGNPASRNKIRRALAQAVLDARAVGIDFAKPWGEIQYADFGRGRVPMHGGDSGDVYNIIRGEAKDGGIHVRFGSSFIQTVAFESTGPRAETFLTYSQSTDPDSPHSSDQAPRFSRLEWIAQPFTQAQIEADSAYRTTTLQE